MDKTIEKGIITKRIDLDLFVEAINSNINGDPDADGRPRQCSLSQKGLISDVAIKRKIRNYLSDLYGEEKGMAILYQEGAVIDRVIEESYDSSEVKKAKTPKEKEQAAQRILCEKFADVRYMGSVLSTGDQNKTAGRVTGPVQVTMGESLDPILVETESITRCCVTNEKDEAKGRTMGTKYRVPYALYRFHIYISPLKAEKSGFTEDDLAKVKEALARMWENDHSSNRGDISLRKGFCFTHESKLGNAPSKKLFDLVKIKRKVDVPTKSEDYEITLEESSLPEGVSVEELKW